MNYFIPFLVVVTISFNVPSCHCGSYWGDLITEKENGRYREYCLTREKMKLFKGSVVTFRDGCFTCNCSKEGLVCKQSYGMILWVPAGCRSVIDGCEPLLVDAKDEFLRCISRIPTNKKETKVLFTRG